MKAIVVVARGLQAGALACYGDPVAETPCVDGLAAEGVVCDHHLADGAEAASARRGWRSGRYPVPLQAGLDAGAVDLLAVLRGGGVHTQLVVDGTRPVDATFAEGWDEAEGVLPDTGETALEATVAVAEEALEGLAGRDRWLLWVELGTALPPWDVPEEFQAAFFREEPTEEDEEDGEEDEEDEEASEPEPPLLPLPDPALGPVDPDDDQLYLRLRNSSGAAVSYLDAGIGKLWDAVVALQLTESVLFVVTGDLGLPLGEHGVVGDGLPLPYQEVVHVPLVVRLPGGAHGGRRVTGLTQGVDLLPTLAAFFEVPLPAVHGQDLLPLLRGAADQVRPYAVSVRGDHWALRTPEWTCLVPAPGEDLVERPALLFIQPDDRYEITDVSLQHLEETEILVRTLRNFAREAAKPGPLVPPPPGGQADS